MKNSKCCQEVISDKLPAAIETNNRKGRNEPYLILYCDVKVGTGLNLLLMYSIMEHLTKIRNAYFFNCIKL